MERKITSKNYETLVPGDRARWVGVKCTVDGEVVDTPVPASEIPADMRGDWGHNVLWVQDSETSVGVTLDDLDRTDIPGMVQLDYVDYAALSDEQLADGLADATTQRSALVDEALGQEGKVDTAYAEWEAAVEVLNVLECRAGALERTADRLQEEIQRRAKEAA